MSRGQRGAKLSNTMAARKRPKSKQNPEPVAGAADQAARPSTRGLFAGRRGIVALPVIAAGAAN